MSENWICCSRTNLHSPHITEFCTCHLEYASDVSSSIFILSIYKPSFRRSQSIVFPPRKRNRIFIRYRISTLLLFFILESRQHCSCYLMTLLVDKIKKRRRRKSKRVWSFGGMIATRRTEVLGETPLLLRLSPPWILKMDWPGIEFRPLQREAGNEPPEPWRAQQQLLDFNERFRMYFPSSLNISVLHIRAPAVIPAVQHLTKFISYSHVFVSCLCITTFATSHVYTEYNCVCWTHDLEKEY